MSNTIHLNEPELKLVELVRDTVEETNRRTLAA